MDASVSPFTAWWALIWRTWVFLHGVQPMTPSYVRLSWDVKTDQVLAAIRAELAHA